MNIIVSNKKWHRDLAEEIQALTGQETVFINSKDLINYEYLNRIKPDYIFFTHWSYIIPASIYECFNCIVFHMTDLPFGRGGSPLQNLIVRGIEETKLSAIKCVKELDAGDIYLKKPLSLHGTAEEVFLRATDLMRGMIIEIINEKPEPVPQEGEPYVFKRRKPQDGCICELDDLKKVFDYIRMLDAEGYPRAFLDIGKFHFEFERASLKDGFIKADVKISMRTD